MDTILGLNTLDDILIHDFDEYMGYINNGWTCVWVGDTKVRLPHVENLDDCVDVKLLKDGHRMFHIVRVPDISPNLTPVRWMNGLNNNGSVRSSNTGTNHTRVATILGICPFSTCGKALENDLDSRNKIMLCGLDIEVTSYYRDRFPLFTDPIISIALSFRDLHHNTWYGYFIHFDNGYVTSRVDNYVNTQRIKIIKCTDSANMVDETIKILLDHSPEFICIHNGYAFDLPCMATHASHKNSAYFSTVNLGASQTGVTMTLPGCTVLDSCHIAMKLHRSDYKGLSLDKMAQTLGLEPKLGYTDFDIDCDKRLVLDNMLEYNYHDSVLHHQVAYKSGFVDEIITMTCLSRSPVYDITRFISGTFMLNLVSAYTISTGHILVWGDESKSTTGEYVGGMVLSPTPGLYDNVAVLDYKSMYPSIITTYNISHDSLVVYNECPYSDVDVDVGKAIIYNKNGVRSIYRPEPDTWYVYLDTHAHGAQCMKRLIEFRTEIRKENPKLGWALKIAANSFYGAYGHSSSALYCREVASSITGIGRFLLGDLVAYTRHMNYDVIYGDTDSVFVTVNTNNRRGMSYKKFSNMINEFVDGYQAICDSNDMTDIILEYEKTYRRLLLIDKKNYIGIKEKIDSTDMYINEIMSLCDIKGVASSRADRTKVSRDISDTVSILMMTTVYNRVESVISKYLRDTIHDIVPRLTASEYTYVTKVSGDYVHRYKSVDGTYVDISQDMISDNMYVSKLPLVDHEWVMKTIYSACDRIVNAALGKSVASLLAGKIVI